MLNSAFVQEFAVHGKGKKAPLRLRPYFSELRGTIWKVEIPLDFPATDSRIPAPLNPRQANLTPSMSAENQESKCCSPWAIAFAHLLTRLWVAERLFMAGVDKFRKGSSYEGTTFSMENYHEKSAQIGKLMASNSFLPEAMCMQYASAIGYVLLAVGAWVAVGLFTELSLFAAGLVLLSLGFGLAALPDDVEVVYIGVSVLVAAAALMTAQAKTFSLDALFFRRKKKD